jgi:hypothetical protein
VERSKTRLVVDEHKVERPAGVVRAAKERRSTLSSGEGKAERSESGRVGGGLEIEVALRHSGEDVTVGVLVILVAEGLAVPVGNHGQAHKGGGGCRGGSDSSRYGLVQITRFVLRVELNKASPRASVGVQSRTEEGVTGKHRAVMSGAVVDIERGGEHFGVDANGCVKRRHNSGGQGPVVLETDRAPSDAGLSALAIAAKEENDFLCERTRQK